MSTIPATTPRAGYHAPDEAQAALAATSDAGLLQAFASLTHCMHEQRTDHVDLRTRRDLIEAEVLRRMDTGLAVRTAAYAAGVDAGATEAGRVAAAALCGVSA